jgi:hypothetical protein
MLERAVTKRQEPSGYSALAEMGQLEKFAFEVVILRHREHFSAEAVARSRERLPKKNR